MRKFLKVHFQHIIGVLLLLVLCITIWGGQVSAPSVYADTGGELKYDSTNALDDLQSSTIDGEPFNIANYPKNAQGTAQMITFVEYCYSQYENGFGNYALYVYVYNPALLEFATVSTQNKIQISTDFYYENEQGKVGDVKEYSKFSLKFCNASGGEYENLFLKFRVVDDENIILNAERKHEQKTGNRYYHISGIELFEVGGSATNAHEYLVNKYYQFSGYAEGYGDSEKFPFTCDSTGQAEAVELDVRHTFYRSETSSKGKGFQNQLDSVYFAVPKRLFDTYGELQRIKAEWYEYKIKDIIVTSNNEFAAAATPWLGKKASNDYDTALGTPAINKDIGYSLVQDYYASSGMGNVQGMTWGWNVYDLYIGERAETLYYLFSVDNIEEYDPYADIVSIGGVESNQLYEYIKNYDKSYDGGTLPIKDGTISADLFADDIDDYRKVDSNYGNIQQGYSYYDFDADLDLQHLSSWQETDPDFWDNIRNWGLWDTIFGDIPEEESRTVAPIEIIEEDDLKGTTKEVSDRLLVNVNDVQALRDYYSEAVTSSSVDDEECVVVLFHFATTDYYSAPVEVWELGTGFLGGDTKISGQAYRAWESVFLDFDVIQLTFNNDGEYHVIPAVSSPIDIVNSITPPVDMGDDWDWLKWVLAVLALIVLLVIFMPILPYIIKAVVWVIMLPFKGIAALVNAIKKAATKKPKTTANSPTKTVKAPQPKTVYVKSDKPKKGKEKQNK